MLKCGHSIESYWGAGLLCCKRWFQRLCLWVKSKSETIQMKATEQYFALFLFVMLYKVVESFFSLPLDEIVKCDHIEWMEATMLCKVILTFESLDCENIMKAADNKMLLQWCLLHYSFLLNMFADIVIFRLAHQISLHERMGSILLLVRGLPHRTGWCQLSEPPPSSDNVIKQQLIMEVFLHSKWRNQT